MVLVRVAPLVVSLNRAARDSHTRRDIFLTTLLTVSMSSSESAESTSVHVTHEPEQSRYTATVDGALAVASYHRQGDVLAFTHTEVPSEIEGRGVASALARRALDDARAAGTKVIPACAFFAHYMDEHPEYEDLRAKR